MYLEMQVINEYFVFKIHKIKVNYIIKGEVIRAQPSLPFPGIFLNYSEFSLGCPLSVVDSEEGLLESMLDYKCHPTDSFCTHQPLDTGL